MSIDKSKKFDENELLDKRADDLNWQIKEIDIIINNFIKSKRKHQESLKKILESIQKECRKTPEGHDYRLFKKAQLEIDRDILKCQKCGQETT